ncbi:hypothetical protein D3C79_693760 [compost metagenome]
MLGNAALQEVSLGRHCIPPQQVANVDLLNIIDFHPAAGQVHDARHTADMERIAFQEVENLPATGAR